MLSRQGAARKARAPLRKPSYLQPCGVPSGTRAVWGETLSGSLRLATAQHQGCSRERTRLKSTCLPSASLPAQKITPALSAEGAAPARDQLGGGGVCRLGGGEKGCRANQRLCLHAPSEGAPSGGQHPSLALMVSFSPRRKRTNAVDNCSGTADK